MKHEIKVGDVVRNVKYETLCVAGIVDSVDGDYITVWEVQLGDEYVGKGKTELRFRSVNHCTYRVEDVVLMRDVVEIPEDAATAEVISNG